MRQLRVPQGKFQVCHALQVDFSQWPGYTKGVEKDSIHDLASTPASLCPGEKAQLNISRVLPVGTVLKPTPIVV